MSILLEALRKSERSQRPAQPASIHMEQQSESGNGRRLGKGPVTILLLILLLVIAWFGWRQYQAPEVGYQPPVSLPVTAGKSVADEEIQPQGEVPRVTQDKSESAGKTESDVVRTPVEKYKKPANVAAKPITKKPTTKKPNTKKLTSNGESTAKASKSQPVAKKPATVKKTSLNKAASTSKGPAPISYWELPDSIRADVPEMKFSVLVYATEPVGRFVLINGERLKEGDSFGQGLTVKEIRRDGVVFTYRLYQFLIER